MDGFHARFMATVSGVGGSLLRARPAQVAKIKLALPMLSKQRRFAALAERIDGQRRAMQVELDSMTTLFASLQNRAFTGTL